jgi:hypothetical protein
MSDDDDGGVWEVLLTHDEFSELLNGLNNYNQEVGGADHEESRLRDGGGVTRLVRVEGVEYAVLGSAIHYLALSRDKQTYQQILQKVKQAGVELDDGEWFECDCGNVAMASDPWNDEPDTCEECGAEVPFYEGGSDA